MSLKFLMFFMKMQLAVFSSIAVLMGLAVGVAHALTGGEQITFQLQHTSDYPNIVEMDLSRNLLVTLYTDEGFMTRNPTWSPNGQWLAFESNRDGSNEIYVMDPDGHNIHLLTDHNVPDQLSFSWSADSRMIVFESNRDFNHEIYLIDSEQATARNLTNNPAHDHMPIWSPDGHHIAFLSNRDAPIPIISNFYIMEVDGSNVHRLMDAALPETEFAWSPDSTQIAFTSHATGNGDLYAINTDGSNLRRLTTNQGFDYNPTWSPDGRHIAFWSWLEGSVAVYLMNADGTNVQQITDKHIPCDYDHVSLAWSTDGKQIVFGVHGSKEGGIYVADVGGSHIQYLLDDMAHHAFTSWRP